MKRLIIFASLTGVFAMPAPTMAITTVDSGQRVSAQTVREIAHYRFDSYVDATDSKMIISTSKPSGKRGRFVIIRINGWINQRFKLTVHSDNNTSAKTTLELLSAKVT
jgi:hypothetical protein